MATIRIWRALLASFVLATPALSAQNATLGGKRAVVYTTADSTNLRLTPSDTLTFQ